MADPLCRPTESKSAPDMNAIITQYRDRIFQLCLLYLGSYALAEDAFQETMLKCWQHYDSFRGEASFATWLSRIAINECKNTLRSGWFRMWKRSEPIDAHTDYPAESSDPHTHVRDAVLALPGMYREVTVLFYYENLSIKEIARLLTIPENTVSTRLRRARTMLQKNLKEEDSHA